MYFLKYLVTDEHATDMDKDLAANHISLAHQIFMRYTSSGTGSRASQIVELLGRRQKQDDDDDNTLLSSPQQQRRRQPRRPPPPFLRIKNHFGASLCYDAFLEAEQIRLRLQDDANNAAFSSAGRLGPGEGALEGCSTSIPATVDTLVAGAAASGGGGGGD